MCSILDLKGFFLKIKNDIVIHVVVVVIIIVMIIIICISDSVFNLFSVIHNTVKNSFLSKNKSIYLLSPLSNSWTQLWMVWWRLTNSGEVLNKWFIVRHRIHIDVLSKTFVVICSILSGSSLDLISGFSICFFCQCSLSKVVFYEAGLVTPCPTLLIYPGLGPVVTLK